LYRETMWWKLLVLRPMVFFRGIHVLLQLSWRDLWNKIRLSPPTKFWLAGSIPFKHKFNSHREKNVLDAASCNINGVCWRDTCVSLSEPTMPGRIQQGVYIAWNTWVALRIPFKTTSILTVKECARCSCI
jgi:hypothetical protein